MCISHNVKLFFKGDEAMREDDTNAAAAGGDTSQIVAQVIFFTSVAIQTVV